MCPREGKKRSSRGLGCVRGARLVGSVFCARDRDYVARVRAANKKSRGNGFSVCSEMQFWKLIYMGVWENSAEMCTRRGGFFFSRNITARWKQYCVRLMDKNDSVKAHKVCMYYAGKFCREIHRNIVSIVRAYGPRDDLGEFHGKFLRRFCTQI